MNVFLSPDFMRYFILGFLFLATCSVSAGNLSDSLKSKPDSWVVLDAKVLNARIEKVVIAGDLWPQSPLMVVLRLFGDDEETQSVLIEEVKNRGEEPDAATIKYVRDGFLDDSVRSDWHQIDLHLFVRIRGSKACSVCHMMHIDGA